MPEKPADNTALIEHIEHALANGLIHPGTGDGPIPLPLPMFSNTSMPDEMARHFAKDAGLPHANVAKLFAEALVSTLEQAGETGSADAIRKVAETIPTAPDAPRPGNHTAATPPRPAINTPPPASTPGPGATPTGSIIATVNGQTVMTDLSDLQKFSADVQPGSRPPFWKKILIMAAIEGITRQAFRRIDITHDDTGSFTVQASTTA